jgi:hypothetical protein
MLSRDRATVTPQKTDITRSRTIASARPSPHTPRGGAFNDAASEVGSYAQRRSSLTDSGSVFQSRGPSYKPAYGLAKTYNSSPLVPRHGHGQEFHELGHGPEGTESTASTAAPSTLWDELDDLKTRMRRLELTGKIPSTSGGAMSRISDDRPPTATTNATTVSASPKRTSGNGAVEAATSSTTSSQRDAQPILFSALSKVRPHLNAEAYEALHSAAADAWNLSQMVGVAGQPGLISSGASTIGTGSATATITDRQLRRKADSICRSLTEFCLALNDDVTLRRPAQAPAAREEMAPLTSPTTTKGFAGLSAARRPSAIADPGLARLGAAPRPVTRGDDRRGTMLNSPALPSPRFALAPSTPTDAVGRKSSLLVSRARRAGTEEPEDNVSRKTSLLRTRRAGTEEPDEGRKSSFLLRTSRNANDEDEEEARFRAPSRAVTEVAGLRAPSHNFAAQGSESSGLGNSALPRRRLVPSSLSSRLATSTAGTPAAAAGRRFLTGQEPVSSPVGEKVADDRGQRQFSLGQTAMLNRTGSLNRRNRESGIPSLSSATASQLGGYR